MTSTHLSPSIHLSYPINGCSINILLYSLYSATSNGCYSLIVLNFHVNSIIGSFVYEKTWYIQGLVLSAVFGIRWQCWNVCPRDKRGTPQRKQWYAKMETDWSDMSTSWGTSRLASGHRNWDTGMNKFCQGGWEETTLQRLEFSLQCKKEEVLCQPDCGNL